jgi:DNA replication protein DnaC
MPLAECDFSMRCENILIAGITGMGKSFNAKANRIVHGAHSIELSGESMRKNKNHINLN